VAKETNLTGSNGLFLGVDFTYPFTIKNSAETAVVEITGWALSWMVKRYKSDADLSAILTKTTSSGITISGTYNSSPSVNTQVATVAIADTDTASLYQGLYHFELKRTDDGSETVESNWRQALRALGLK
jgi:hypothetical protein